MDAELANDRIWDEVVKLGFIQQKILKTCGKIEAKMFANVFYVRMLFLFLLLLLLYSACATSEETRLIG